MPQALLIQGGIVVNADGETRADVLCVDGRVAAIGPDLRDDDRSVYLQSVDFLVVFVEP